MEKLIQYGTTMAISENSSAWQSVGMGYILCTERGKLIVIDGGIAEDAEALVNLLETTAGGKADIALWIITHPHLDHYGALCGICKREDLLSRVNVQEILFDFPEPDRYEDNRIPAARESLRYIFEKTGAKEHKPIIDEKIQVDSMEFHILNTPVDCTLFRNSNELSLIFTIQCTEKKIMITGDAGERNMQMVLWRYPDNLQCDILQMPHHGLCDTGHQEFFEKVNAKTLLIPTSRVNEETMRTDPYFRLLFEKNIWAEENADVIYKAYDGTAEICL